METFVSSYVRSYCSKYGNGALTAASPEAPTDDEDGGSLYTHNIHHSLGVCAIIHLKGYSNTAEKLSALQVSTYLENYFSKVN